MYNFFLWDDAKDCFQKLHWKRQIRSEKKQNKTYAYHKLIKSESPVCGRQFFFLFHTLNKFFTTSSITSRSFDSFIIAKV